MLSKIEISHKTIIFTAVFLASIWLVLQIRDILFLVFIAFIIMSALRPLVESLEKRRIPRILSIIVIYILFFGIFGGALASTIPSLVVQSTKLFQSFPGLIAKVVPVSALDINTVGQQIGPIGENIIKFSVGVFSNIFTTVTVLVFAFYFLLERKNLEMTLDKWLGNKKTEKVMGLIHKIESRLGAWVQGELILMLTIGILCYIGLLILGIDFAVPLAILAGLMEIVPTVGPIISAIPAVVVGLSISPLVALSVAVLFFIIHQAENTFIVPFVMKKSVNLSPIITIFSLLVGGQLAGIAGAVLAVPIVLIVQEIIKFYTESSEEK